MDKNRVLKMLEQSLNNVRIARDRYQLAQKLYDESDKKNPLRESIEENYTEAAFVYDASVDEYSEILKLYDKEFNK